MKMTVALWPRGTTFGQIMAVAFVVGRKASLQILLVFMALGSLHPHSVELTKIFFLSKIHLICSLTSVLSLCIKILPPQPILRESTLNLEKILVRKERRRHGTTVKRMT